MADLLVSERTDDDYFFCPDCKREIKLDDYVLDFMDGDTAYFRCPACKSKEACNLYS